MKRKIVIPYNQKLKELAKHLRKSSTLSEVLLWRYLKRKQLLGYDFDRQKPIDNYIVDFFCNELMLAIEIDGRTHNYKSEEDRKRQTKLESLGVRFLRFNDLDIKKNMNGVLNVIGDWIREHTNKFAQCIPCLSQEKEPTPVSSLEGNNQKQKPKKGI
jgi:very-short-patch-repair endonuclease